MAVCSPCQAQRLNSIQWMNCTLVAAADESEQQDGDSELQDGDYDTGVQANRKCRVSAMTPATLKHSKGSDHSTLVPTTRCLIVLRGSDA